MFQHDEFADTVPVSEQEFIFIRLCVLREVGQQRGRLGLSSWDQSRQDQGVHVRLRSEAARVNLT